MKKLVALAVGILIGSFLTSVHAQENVSFPDESDLFFALESGVRIDLVDALDEVLNKFGEPVRKSISEDSYHVGVEYAVFAYDKFVVAYFDDLETMLGTWIRSPSIRSSRGVQVGDPARKIIDTYGRPTFQSENRISYAVIVRELDFTASLAFDVNDDVVVQMSMSVAW